MARPQRIVLVRHGESKGNADDTVYEREPDHALPLTGAGRHQAEETGRHLRELFGGERVSVYVSPYRRTHQTLRAFRLDPGLVRIREEPRLR
ncbi:phosphoglycerate mutase family protein, partial [Streptomyces sp. NPDC002454]